MEFPALQPVALRHGALRSFGGYCRREQVEQGAFYDMQNMTGDHFPFLSPREGRGVLSTREPGLWDPSGAPPQALAASDGLCVLRSGILYFDLRSGLFQKAELGLSDSEPKQLIPFGSRLIVLPDKKYIDLRNPEDRGDLEARFAPAEAVALRFCLCNREGTVYSAGESDTQPTEPTDGQYWLDTSGYATGGSCRLFRYAGATEQWKSVSPLYVRLEAEGIGAAFQAGDWIFLHGEGLGAHPALRGLCNGAKEIVAAQEHMLVLDFSMGKAVLALDAVEKLRLERNMPEMDFVFAYGNRLWGCRYGYDPNGRFVNEIYASKEGDMKNWHCFRGEDSDSLCLPCVTDGPWTGAIHALGQPLFFKENYLHRVYGEGANQFRLQTLACRGVQQGSHRSLAVVNGLLYYKTVGGVVCFDGALPESVSEDLGTARYHGAVAGVLGDKYYISMLDEKECPQLFCYDSKHRFWHREDCSRITALCAVEDRLYYLEEGKPLVGILAGAESVEQPVAWFVETGPMDGGDAQQHYLRRISLRLKLDTGSRLRFLVQYDSCGIWQPISGITGGRVGTVTVALPLRRCDHLRLRIEGEGKALIYGLYTELAPGGICRQGR